LWVIYFDAWWEFQNADIVLIWLAKNDFWVKSFFIEHGSES